VPVKTVQSLKLLLYLLALALLAWFRHEYNVLTANLALPEKFEHTFYRVLVAFAVIEAIRLVVVLTYKTNTPRRSKDNFTIGVGHVSKILYATLAAVLLMSLFSITVKEALTSLSVIAAAIVLITKDYISNLINGMYLTFNRIINIGDQVQIGNQRGKIQDITLTNVHLLNDDDDLIYIPNNTVFSTEIINYTRRELKKSSVDFELPAGALLQPEALEGSIIDVLAPVMDDIQPGTCTLKVQQVRFEYVGFKFQFILKHPLNKETDKKVRRLIIRHIVCLRAGQVPVGKK
jgi:small-conductance mechanosensitive channel